MSKQATADATATQPLFELESELFELHPPKIPADDLDAVQLEFFFPEDNPEQPAPTPQIEFDGMAKPIFAVGVVHPGGQGSVTTVIQFQHANTLLESLEAQGVNVPYQCRDGYCGSCRTKITSGNVAYLQEPMAWVNEGEILPCCCVPKSDLQLLLQG